MGYRETNINTELHIVFNTFRVMSINIYITFISLFCLPEINFGYWLEISIP